ncbi:MAG: hypothetical protein RIC16_01445 [Rhodospirillales bacterium]
MKRLALAIAFLLFVAGSAIGVMRYMKIGIFAPPPGTVAEVKAPVAPSFIDMEPLVINIFDGSKVTATVQVVVKLQTVGKEDTAFVNKNLPRLSNAFLQDLHSFLPRLLKRGDSHIDVFVLKKRLKLIADRLYPNEPVADVLIQAINEN